MQGVWQKGEGQAEVMGEFSVQGVWQKGEGQAEVMVVCRGCGRKGRGKLK